MMMKKKHLVQLLVVLAFVPAAWAATYDLSWRTIDGGGGRSTGGSFTLSGTIGQPDARFSSGGAFELTGGFWVPVGTPGPGDCDGDGDLDLADYACFANCLSGPESVLGGGCSQFDLDFDGDVDLLDWAVFSSMW
jgi:hypothetical protein